MFNDNHTHNTFSNQTLDLGLYCFTCRLDGQDIIFLKDEDILTSSLSITGFETGTWAKALWNDKLSLAFSS